MLGTGQFIETHPDPENIIAAFTMDNLGKYYYDAMNMETIGQCRAEPAVAGAARPGIGNTTEGLWQPDFTRRDRPGHRSGHASILHGSGPTHSGRRPGSGFCTHTSPQNIWKSITQGGTRLKIRWSTNHRPR